MATNTDFVTDISKLLEYGISKGVNQGRTIAVRVYKDFPLDPQVRRRQVVISLTQPTLPPNGTLYWLVADPNHPDYLTIQQFDSGVPVDHEVVPTIFVQEDDHPGLTQEEVEQVFDDKSDELADTIETTVTNNMETYITETVNAATIQRVQNLTDLKAIDTTNLDDKYLVFVEDEWAIYWYDINGNPAITIPDDDDIVLPNSLTGLWKKTQDRSIYGGQYS